MAKLIVADARRADKAKGFVEKAVRGKGLLTPAMQKDLDLLKQRADGS